MKVLRISGFCQAREATCPVCEMPPAMEPSLARRGGMRRGGIIFYVRWKGLEYACMADACGECKRLGGMM